MTRIIRDLDFATTVGLLVAAVATSLTGLIADLWDLQDFWYHTVSGYVMGVFAIAHVLFNRERLVGYARFRWRTMRHPATATPVQRPRTPPREAEPVGWSSTLARAVVSRRGLFGITVGSVAGIVLG